MYTAIFYVGLYNVKIKILLEHVVIFYYILYTIGV